ncbi:hypothetical protein B5K06_12290 [Rhizobium grahamii]|uniref:Uncharacterized protein n=1 Tax=Rhizobium grahamii TaxID=1120045 RepID=A0A370KQG8_9HYPH|nr:hypothetical protein B5K06_12290 [Rhizobium grahamii]
MVDGRDRDIERKVLQGLPQCGYVKPLCEVGQPLLQMGFSETEIVKALVSLTHKRIIQLLPGNQLRVLKNPILALIDPTG